MKLLFSILVNSALFKACCHK